LREKGDRECVSVFLAVLCGFFPFFPFFFGGGACFPLWASAFFLRVAFFFFFPQSRMEYFSSFNLLDAYCMALCWLDGPSMRWFHRKFFRYLRHESAAFRRDHLTSRILGKSTLIDKLFSSPTFAEKLRSLLARVCCAFSVR